MVVIGVGLIAVGVPLIPLPGPGWALVFAGLGVLSTRWPRLRRLLRLLRRLVAATPPGILGAALILGGLLVWWSPVRIPNQQRAGLLTVATGVVVLLAQIPPLRRRLTTLRPRRGAAGGYPRHRDERIG